MINEGGNGNDVNDEKERLDADDVFLMFDDTT